MALADDGSVWTWGRNVDGRLGDGTRIDRDAPVQVVSLAGVTAIDAGDFHCIALRDDGTAWAWGYNSDGQLGDGTGQDQSVPVQVRDLFGVVAVGAGGFGSMAVREDGSVWTWGLVGRPGAVGWRRGGEGAYPFLAKRVGYGGAGSSALSFLEQRSR